MRASLILLLYVSFISVLGPLPSSAQNDSCQQDGFQLMYQTIVNGNKFQLWEESPSSSYSVVKIEKLDLSGSTIWTARGERGCSQGVSRCYLTIPYALDGTLSGQIEAEMNWFSTSNDQLILLSHLSEKIMQVYFKNHPFQEFSLPAFEGSNDANLQEEDFEIPNFFEVSGCQVR